jgi:hypothetical protein
MRLRGSLVLFQGALNFLAKGLSKSRSIRDVSIAVMTMTIRWYRLAVFALWLSAMSWLAVRKILPTFLVGEAPIYQSVVDNKPRPPVAWNIYLNERRLGWALSEIGQQSTDTTEIHSLVHFDYLPFDELLPVYLRDIARASTQTAKSMQLEVESNLITNPLNQLVSFYSKLRPKSGQSLVKIDGSVEGDRLKISVHLGEATWDTDLPMPENKIRDSFAPEMELRGLRYMQSWTIVTYSPLALPSNPLDVLRKQPPTEVLYARVEERPLLTWNGKTEPTWVVVYRSEASGGPGNDKNIRNRLWVRRDGKVVRQDVFLGDRCLIFRRLPERDALELQEKYGEFQKQTSIGHD